jgi:DNA recombination protein RmuC
MEIGLIILAVAMVLAAAIFAFARPKAAPESRVDPRLDELIRGQGNISGQFEQTVAAQNQLSARLDNLSERLGTSLKENTDKTGETLGGIQARLTVIDEAQKNIADLSGQVTSLQQILSNKQARGAFAQRQLESLVRDGLPASLYDFEFTLSNHNRPDCVIRMPGSKSLIVIDSKFPLESFKLLHVAMTDEEKKTARAQVRNDILKHIKDIAGKYLIPGEVQTPAVMFIASEAICQDIHAEFDDLIQKAQRAQVTIVSPNILMLAINTILTMLRDVRMLEQADQIRKEVGVLMTDVRRLGERVVKLQNHFAQAEGDLKDITVSADKIVSRGEKIEKVELTPREPKLIS